MTRQPRIPASSLRVLRDLLGKKAIITICRYNTPLRENALERFTRSRA